MATYTLTLPCRQQPEVKTHQACVLRQHCVPAESDGSVLNVVGFGHNDNGLIAIDACPSGLSGCLSGLSSGTYAIFELPSDTAIVSGTVSDASGARSGIVVRSDRLTQVVSISDTNGRFILPAPIGIATKLSARDVANDLAGEATITPMTENGALSTEHVQLVLSGTPPEIIDVDPANQGSNVSSDAVLTVTFSEPVIVPNDAVQLTMQSPRPLGADDVPHFLTGHRLGFVADMVAWKRRWWCAGGNSRPS